MTLVFKEVERYLVRSYDGHIFTDTRSCVEALHTGDRYYLDLRHRIERCQTALSTEQERNLTAVHFFGDTTILLNYGLILIMGKNEVMHCTDLMNVFFCNARLQEDKFIRDSGSKVICSISPLVLDKLYQLPSPQVQMAEIKEWAETKYNLKELLINWLEYRGTVYRESNWSIPIGQFRMTVIMAMTLMSRLFGNKDTIVVNETYLLVLRFLIDKLTPLLAKLLNIRIKTNFHSTNEKKVKEFYMNSYMLDVLCAHNPIPKVKVWDPSVHISIFFSKLHINNYKYNMHYIYDVIYFYLYKAIDNVWFTYTVL